MVQSATTSRVVAVLAGAVRVVRFNAAPVVRPMIPGRPRRRGSHVLVDLRAPGLGRGPGLTQVATALGAFDRLRRRGDAATWADLRARRILRSKPGQESHALRPHPGFWSARRPHQYATPRAAAEPGRGHSASSKPGGFSGGTPGVGSAYPVTTAPDTAATSAP